MAASPHVPPCAPSRLGEPLLLASSSCLLVSAAPLLRLSGFPLRLGNSSNPGTNRHRAYHEAACDGGFSLSWLSTSSKSSFQPATLLQDWFFEAYTRALARLVENPVS